MELTEKDKSLVRAYSCRSCQSIGTCKELLEGKFCKFALDFAKMCGVKLEGA